MAIKGKGKTRSRRAVAGGPKPVYVVPRKPFLRRRSTRVGAVGLLVAVVGGVLLGVWMNQRAADRLALRREAVLEFAARLEQPLSPIATPLPPTGLKLFADLGDLVAQLREGSIDPSVAIRQADSNGRLAESAGEAVADIPAADLVRDKGMPIELLDTKEATVTSLDVFAQATELIRLAAEAGPGDEREDLLDVAERMLATADSLFSSGYLKLVNARFELGLGEAQPFAPGFEEPLT
ncbi:MAG: hypothetical protein HY658_14720 [Actinobacteria bacterium]|nr:hypothetical protein [Actinomycetota bacterium]